MMTFILCSSFHSYLGLKPVTAFSRMQPKEESAEAFPGSQVEDKIKNWFSENVNSLYIAVLPCSVHATNTC